MENVETDCALRCELQAHIIANGMLRIADYNRGNTLNNITGNKLYVKAIKIINCCKIWNDDDRDNDNRSL